MPSERRFYRQVGSVEEAQTAIHELTDHTYELRRQMEEMRGQHAEAMAGMKKQVAKLGDLLNTQVAGINVKATTDALSLQNGYTIRFNSATGEFEFGV